MVALPGLLVVEEYDRFLLGIGIVAVDPHVALGIRRTSVLRHPERSLVGMDDAGVVKLLMKLVIYKGKVFLSTFDHPVAEGVRFQVHAHLPERPALAVDRLVVRIC